MPRGNILSTGRVVVFLVFLYPIFTCTIQSWHSGIFALCILVCLVPARKQWFLFDDQEKQMVYALVIFVTVAFLSLINAQDLQQSAQRLWRLGYLLGLVPLVLVARRFRLDLTRPFFAGMLPAVLVLASVGFYQVEFLGWERAQGITNPVLFGNITLLYAALGTGLLFAKTALDRYRFLVIIGTLLALGASALSGSRGAWMALPPILFFVFWLQRDRITFRAAVTGGVVLFLAGAMVFASAGEQVAERWRVTSRDVQTYLDSSDRNTSIGQRLLMWQIAWESFREHPFIGSGLGDFRHDTLRMISSGETVLNKDFGHSHSIYFEFLGMTGLAGFLAMVLSIIVLPFRYFWRQWGQSAPGARSFPALAGMITILCFAIFGLSDNWFARSITMTVYVTSLLVFWASCPTAAETVFATKRSRDNLQTLR